MLLWSGYIGGADLPMHVKPWTRKEKKTTQNIKHKTQDKYMSAFVISQMS